MKKYIDNILCYFFTTAMRSVGYLIIFIGFFLIYSLFNIVDVFAIVILFFISLIVISVGVFVSFSKEGVQVDAETKHIRRYTTFYFFKIYKEWKSFDLYPYLAVRNMKFSSAVYSRANIPQIISETFYDIFLLDKTHRDKILIKRLKNKEKAIEEANTIANQLGVEFVIYNPVISSKTTARQKR